MHKYEIVVILAGVKKKSQLDVSKPFLPLDVNTFPVDSVCVTEGCKKLHAFWYWNHGVLWLIRETCLYFM